MISVECGCVQVPKIALDDLTCLTFAVFWYSELQYEELMHSYFSPCISCLSLQCCLQPFHGKESLKLLVFMIDVFCLGALKPHVNAFSAAVFKIFHKLCNCFM
jgi:hypothetical protein